MRRAVKAGLEMRESQCLDTDLNLWRDFIGRWRRISARTSSFSDTISAEGEGGDGGEAAVMAEADLVAVILRLVDGILKSLVLKFEVSAKYYMQMGFTARKDCSVS